MKITFSVGHSEKHKVEFRWNQFIGRAVVRIDGRTIVKSKPLALSELSQLIKLRLRPLSALKGFVEDLQNINLRRQWTVEVGTKEKSLVTIVKERPRLLAGLLPHRYYVFVDGDKVRECSGY